VRITGIGFNESRVLQISPLALDDCRGKRRVSLFVAPRAHLTPSRLTRNSGRQSRWGQQRDGGGADGRGIACSTSNQPDAYKTVALLQSPTGARSVISHVF
jgi:hypothetical protein